MDVLAPGRLPPLKALGRSRNALPRPWSIGNNGFRSCEKLTRGLFEQPCAVVVEPDQPAENPLDDHEAWRQTAGPSVQHRQDEQIAEIVIAGPPAYLGVEGFMPYSSSGESDGLNPVLLQPKPEFDIVSADEHGEGQARPVDHIQRKCEEPPRVIVDKRDAGTIDLLPAPHRRLNPDRLSIIDPT